MIKTIIIIAIIVFAAILSYKIVFPGIKYEDPVFERVPSNLVEEDLFYDTTTGFVYSRELIRAGLTYFIPSYKIYVNKAGCIIKCDKYTMKCTAYTIEEVESSK